MNRLETRSKKSMRKPLPGKRKDNWGESLKKRTEKN